MACGWQQCVRYNLSDVFGLPSFTRHQDIVLLGLYTRIWHREREKKYEVLIEFFGNRCHLLMRSSTSENSRLLTNFVFLYILELQEKRHL